MAHTRGKDRTRAYRERLKNRGAADPDELGHVAIDPLSGGGPVVAIDDGAELHPKCAGCGQFLTGIRKEMRLPRCSGCERPR